MKLFSPEMRKPLLLQLAVIVICFVICLLYSPPAALVMLGGAVAMLLIQGLFMGKRQQKIMDLCDEIDQILHGADAVSFAMFQEGELSMLSSEIQKMTVRLREQNAILREDRQFMKEALEDMSHQLRTPLTTMLLILGMMREPELTKMQRMQYVQELCSLLSRMQWMLETMLNLSRLEAGAVTFQKEQLTVAELLHAALEPLSIAIELKGITFHTRIEGEPVLLGDRQYCTEALVNLLKNCMEHTPEGGSISAFASENSIYTGIRITDTGSGIAEEDLPHIFERFYRNSAFSKSGYGIGLAFAQKIIASQHGSIHVRNARPHGAEFDIRFYKTVV